MFAGRKRYRYEQLYLPCRQACLAIEQQSNTQMVAGLAIA
jgi:hypothetical protein